MEYTEYYQFRKPTKAVDIVKVGDINFNSEKIDELIHSTQVSLAPAYDATRTSSNPYMTGDVVMKDALMYRCLEDDVYGAWDASKWERTTASESGGGGSAELDILGEASGAVASFADGASAELAKCIAEIVPKQAGSGTPSPDNVRAISGSTSVTVTVSDGETSTTKTTPLGQTVYGGQLNVLTGELKVTHEFKTYTGDASENWIYTSSSNRVYINVADAYRPQLFAEIQSNILHYTQAIREDYGAYINGQANFVIYAPNTITSASDWKTWLTSNNIQVVYELATPQTVQLTPQEVNSLLGQNNISADTGDIDIVYVKASSPIQPNPTGTPTATLKKLGIEGTVFELEDGSGGGNVYGAFIDTNNVIQAFTTIQDTNEHTYTATEDCVVVYQSANTANGNTAIKVDGVTIGGQYVTQTSAVNDYVFLKTGQTFSFQQSFTSLSTTGFEVYGLTYGPQAVPQVHYSTDEQVIGTYLGETLYQKTYIINNPTSGGVDLNSGLNVDTVVHQFGTWERSINGRIWTYDLNAQNEIDLQTQFSVLCRYKNSTNQIYYYYSNSGAYSGAVSKIIYTVQYTKSSL